MLVRSVSDSGWTVVAVMGGFALVNNNKVTILVNEAELGSVRIGVIFVFDDCFQFQLGFSFKIYPFYYLICYSSYNLKV